MNGVEKTEPWEVSPGRSALRAVESADIVYFGLGDGLYAVEAVTGAERWRFEAEFGTLPVGVIGGTLITMTHDSDGDALCALDAVTGNVQWNVKCNGLVTNAVVDGTVYMEQWSPRGESGASSSRLSAHDASTGAERWRFELDGVMFNFHEMSVEGGSVYLLAWDNRDPHRDREDARLLALDGLTGVERWSLQVAGGPGTPDTQIRVQDGMVCVGSPTTLFALDATNGQERWRLQGVRPFRLVGAGRMFYTLYLRSPDDFQESWIVQVVRTSQSVGAGGVVHAAVTVSDRISNLLMDLDSQTGQESWRVPLSCGGDPFAIGRGVVYVYDDGSDWEYGSSEDDEPLLYALDAKTGAKRWSWEPGWSFGDPVLADEIIYVPSLHHLHALDAKTGTERWRFAFAPPSSANQAADTHGTPWDTLSVQVLNNVVYATAHGTVYALAHPFGS